MGYKIGFIMKSEEEKRELELLEKQLTEMCECARKSVVQVTFDGYGKGLAYYNDRFDLRPGDLVFVDGKLEGKQGTVTAVNYNFKIKLTDYQRVIAVADTKVKGRLYFAGSHFVVFDRKTLPKEKIKTWFLPPAGEEEYAYSTDDTAFALDNLQGLKASAAIVERGIEYYRQNRVRYLCVEDTKGYAIVEGETYYEVEFVYREGEVSGLTCTCFCNYPCKHEVATMMQLRETLECITQQYDAEYIETGYFAAICKPTLFRYAVDGEVKGSIVLGE